MFMVTLRDQSCTLMAMCPWSWYMASTPSNAPSMAWLKTVSAGTGPVASMPSSRASSTAGPMASVSSAPMSPASPPCGLSAAAARRGSGMPCPAKKSWVSRSAASTFSRVTASQASRSERCVVRGTTRSPGVRSMVMTRSAPVSAW